MTKWDELEYGLAPQEAFATLSGRELLQKMVDREFPAPTICRQLTFGLIEIGEGFAVFEGETGPHLLNPMGGVHGGWALTLIDSAAGCAAQSLLPPGTAYGTIETKVNFSKPIRADTGVVRCESKVVAAGKTIMSCEAWLRDSKDVLLAHGTSTVFVMAPRS